MITHVQNAITGDIVPVWMGLRVSCMQSIKYANFTKDGEVARAVWVTAHLIFRKNDWLFSSFGQYFLHIIAAIRCLATWKNSQ